MKIKRILTGILAAVMSLQLGMTAIAVDYRDGHISSYANRNGPLGDTSNPNRLLEFPVDDLDHSSYFANSNEGLADCTFADINDTVSKANKVGFNLLRESFRLEFYSQLEMVTRKLSSVANGQERNAELKNTLLGWVRPALNMGKQKAVQIFHTNVTDVNNLSVVGAGNSLINVNWYSVLENVNLGFYDCTYPKRADDTCGDVLGAKYLSFSVGGTSRYYWDISKVTVKTFVNTLRRAMLESVSDFSYVVYEYDSEETEIKLLSEIGTEIKKSDLRASYVVHPFLGILPLNQNGSEIENYEDYVTLYYGKESSAGYATEYSQLVKLLTFYENYLWSSTFKGNNAGVQASWLNWGNLRKMSVESDFSNDDALATNFISFYMDTIPCIFLGGSSSYFASVGSAGYSLPQPSSSDKICNATLIRARYLSKEISKDGYYYNFECGYTRIHWSYFTWLVNYIYDTGLEDKKMGLYPLNDSLIPISLVPGYSSNINKENSNISTSNVTVAENTCFNAMLPLGNITKWYADKSDNGIYGIYHIYENVTSPYTAKSAMGSLAYNLESFRYDFGGKGGNADKTSNYMYRLQTTDYESFEDYYADFDVNFNLSFYIEPMTASLKQQDILTSTTISNANKKLVVSEISAISDGAFVDIMRENEMVSTITNYRAAMQSDVYYNVLDGKYYTPNTIQTATYSDVGVAEIMNNETRKLTSNWSSQTTALCTSLYSVFSSTMWDDVTYHNLGVIPVSLQPYIYPFVELKTEVQDKTDFYLLTVQHGGSAISIRHNTKTNLEKISLTSDSPMYRTIAIPKTYSEYITEYIETVTKSETSLATETEYSARNIVTGRRLSFNIQKLESVDLASADKAVQYSNAASLSATGLYYNTTGRVSTTQPMDLNMQYTFTSDGPSIRMTDTYYTDSGLLDWLQTDNAIEILANKATTNGYTAGTLYTKLVGNGANIVGDAPVDNIGRYQEIESELAAARETSIVGTILDIIAFMGIAIIVYAMLLFLAYYIDIFNAFVDIKLLKILTFGGCEAVRSKEELAYLGVTDAKMRRRYLTFKDIILRWALCIIIGTMLFTASDVYLFVMQIYLKIMSLFGLE